MKNTKKHLILFILLLYCNCTGWPLLQHEVATSLQTGDNKTNSIYSLLFIRPNQNSRGNSGVTTTSETNTPTSLASTKDILSFGIQTPNATGAISGTNITVTVAGNTNLKNLIANFTHNGSSVKIGAVTQTSGVTSNNFSYTMTYTVYAQDGSSQNYTVNVYATSCSAAAFCRIFAHAPASPAADFGSIPGAFGDGIVGIDTECNNGAIMIGLPPSNYRAILMTTGGTTIRNQTTNWVLKPNKQYRRQDGTTIIGTTNASSVFAVSGGNLTNSVVGAFSNIYTGILVNSDTSWTPSASNCSNWTSSAAVSVYGANGNFTNTLSFSDAGNSQTCNTGVGVYCVEQ